MECFILHGKVASVFEQCGLSVDCQLRVTFLMLSTKNYKHKVKFVKVINQNTLSFFTSDTIKTAFSMTS